MPITSESQRNRVALLIALNVLLLVAYAVYILASISTPSPLLISVLIAGLGYNLAELWLSTPYRGETRRTGQKARTVRRAAPRTLPGETDPNTVMLGRTTPSAGSTKRRSGFGERGSLAERLSALEEGTASGQRIDPSLAPIEETILGAESAQSGLDNETPVTPMMDVAPPDSVLLSTASERAMSGELDQGAIDPEPAVREAVQAGDTQASNDPSIPLDKAAAAARALVNALRTPEEVPHSEHSALTVDIVEAEIQTAAPIADVAELENLLDAVEAEGEVAATMDALEQLGTVVLAEANTARVAEPVIPEVAPELSELQEEIRVAEPVVLAQATEFIDTVEREEPVTVSIDSSQITVVSDEVAASVMLAEVTVTEPASAQATESEPGEVEVAAAIPTMVVEELPLATVEVETSRPVEPNAGWVPAEAVAGVAEEGVAVESTSPVPTPTSEPTTAGAALSVAVAATVASTVAATRVIGLGADLIGDDVADSADARPAALVDATPEKLVETKSAEEKPAEEKPARVAAPISHLGGRLREPVDVVIATLQTDPVRKPATNTRRRAGVSMPSVPVVPPRAATGLRASDETLALLRSQLGVGKDAEAESARRTRVEVDQERPTESATESATGAPKHKAPLGAPRRTSPQVADNARDRVMFVWHGRHFLAPMEGRHPLRVAQSLYDFMVEEAMERG